VGRILSIYFTSSRAILSRKRGITEANMSKDTAQDSNLNKNALSFIGFWQLVASELGSSRLKINDKTNSIQHLVDCNSDPKDYLKKAIQQSYKRSNCHHLRDTVDLNAVLDVLGETAYTLQNQHADDLLDIELLEEIAWLISERYPNHLAITPPVLREEPTVISLSKTKIIKANSRL